MKIQHHVTLLDGHGQDAQCSSRFSRGLGVRGVDTVIDTTLLLIQSGLADIACPQLTQL